MIAVVAAGCGGDEAGGSNTLTWFIFNEPSASPQTAAEKCAKESGRRVRDRVRVPAQRRRRPARAARPPARRRGRLDRPDRHGRDLDRRVRERGLDRAGAREHRPGGLQGRLPERARDGEVRGRALRGAAVVEHRVALVSLRPGRAAAEDLGRDDRRGRAPEPGREPDPGPGQQVRGPGRLVQPDDRVRRRRKSSPARRSSTCRRGRPSARSRSWAGSRPPRPPTRRSRPPRRTRTGSPSRPAAPRS